MFNALLQQYQEAQSMVTALVGWAILGAVWTAHSILEKRRKATPPRYRPKHEA